MTSSVARYHLRGPRRCVSDEPGLSDNVALLSLLSCLSPFPYHSSPLLLSPITLLLSSVSTPLHSIIVFHHGLGFVIGNTGNTVLVIAIHAIVRRKQSPCHFRPWRLPEIISRSWSSLHLLSAAVKFKSNAHATYHALVATQNSLP